MNLKWKVNKLWTICEIFSCVYILINSYMTSLKLPGYMWNYTYCRPNHLSAIHPCSIHRLYFFIKYLNFCTWAGAETIAGLRCVALANCFALVLIALNRSEVCLYFSTPIIVNVIKIWITNASYCKVYLPVGPADVLDVPGATLGAGILLHTTGSQDLHGLLHCS